MLEEAENFTTVRFSDGMEHKIEHEAMLACAYESFY
jgi:hypothetical protein